MKISSRSRARGVPAWLISLLAALGCVGRLHAQSVEPPITEDVVALEAIYDAVRSAAPSPEQVALFTALKLRTAERDLPRQGADPARRDFARAWKLIAAISRDLVGDTEEVVEYYRIASGLDPTDAHVTRELAFRQQKLDAVNERIEEARRLREIDAKNSRN